MKVNYTWNYDRCQSGIKPLKRGFRDAIPIGFDTETIKGEFYTAQLCVNGIENNIFYDREEAIKFILSKRFRGEVIWGFNLEYDFDVLFDAITYPEFMKEKGYDVRIFSLGDGNMFARIYQKGNTNYWKFYDLRSFYKKGSLDYVGEKVLGMKKLEKPDYLGERKPKMDEKKHFEDYALRDSYLTSLLANRIYEWHKKFDISIKPTSASFSSAVFRKHFLGDKIRFHSDNIEQILEGYAGGRTEAIGRGYFGNLKIYDVNSMYPFSMLKDYPIMPLQKYSYSKFCEDDDLVGVMKARVRIDEHETYGCLPKRILGKLCFPVGEFEGVFFTPEIREGLKHGVLEIQNVDWIYANHPVEKSYFDEFIRYFYKMKLEAERNGDEESRFWFKLIMNSLYGKFFQSNVEKIPIAFDDLELGLKEGSLVGDEIEFDIYNMPFLKSRIRKAGVTFNPVIAGLITSYSRALLYRLARKLKALYMDTDSVFLRGYTDYNVGSKLGEMKLEAKDDFILFRSKYYIPVNSNKIGIHGVRMRKDEFKKIFWEIQNDRIGIFEYITRRMTKPKEALIQKKKPRIFEDEIRKISFSEDGKRIYNQNLRTLDDLKTRNTLSVPLKNPD